MRPRILTTKSLLSLPSATNVPFPQHCAPHFQNHQSETQAFDKHSGSVVIKAFRSGSRSSVSAKPASSSAAATREEVSYHPPLSSPSLSKYPVSRVYFDSKNRSRNRETRRRKEKKQAKGEREIERERKKERKQRRKEGGKGIESGLRRDTRRPNNARGPSSA